MRLLPGPLLSVLAVLACAGAAQQVQHEAGAHGTSRESHSDAALAPEADKPASPAATPARVARQASASPALACPGGMQLLTRPQGSYCIDRYEASLVEKDEPSQPWPGNRSIDGDESKFMAVSVPGVKPQGYVSGAQAARVCANAGKRLCEMDEWVRACRGPEFTLYPYGSQRLPNVCNDRYQKLDRHPVVRLFNQKAPPGTAPEKMWHQSWMNDPALHEMTHSVAKTGEFAECKNAYEIYDMVGNLHEWVADANGIFVGGFFMDTYQNGEGCEYRTIAHPNDYHDYSTGFRCCADPARAALAQRERAVEGGG